MRWSHSACLALVAVFLAPHSSAAETAPSGAELLAASIAFHDPDATWGQQALAFAFDESRPDGSVRKTAVAIDIANERFSWSSTSTGHDVAGDLEGATCELRLDGRTEFSDAEREEHRLTCERLQRLRDYYTYLWGLPMKLRDAGTRVGEEVTVTEFEGMSVFSIKVTYDEEVGGDTWYFYFDPTSSALVGYRFFHDETKNDGEVIVLEGLTSFGSLRLPMIRAWYYNDGRGYLGTDTLVSLASAGHEPGRAP